MRFVKLSFILMIFLAASLVFADKMDLSEHTLVISKLERVLQVIEKSNPSRIQIILRLGDLHSERARLYEIEANKQEEKKDAQADSKKSEKSDDQNVCDGDCTKLVSEDRKQALELYQKAFDEARPDQKGKVLLQMAQLFELQGETEKAKQLYESVISKEKDYEKDVVGHAYAGLGEIYFNKVNFDTAEDYFKRALKCPGQSQAYLTSRLAWCYFHKGDFELAIKTLRAALKPGANVDTSFYEEGSRDLATFYSRENIGPKEVKILEDLSPPQTRLDNLSYMAAELDRLGKKKSALYVWSVIDTERKSCKDCSGDLGQGYTSKSGDQPKNRLDEQLQLVQLQYDINRKDKVVSELDQIVSIWNTDGCGSKEDCDNAKSRLRKLVTNWGKADENSPSPLLIRAYSDYLALFADVDMNYWAAEAARKIHDYVSALRFYKNVSSLAQNASGEKLQKMFEGALLGEIEVAELSRDVKARDDAYSHYIAVNPHGSKNMEVRYQKAHILYEQSRFNDAAQSFKAVALINDSESESLREKAADLALDSLVIARNETLIEPWAQDFANTFPKKREEYLKISRKAALNQVAQTMDSTNGESNLAKLKALDLHGANDSEKTAYYKNKLILAERLRNIPEAEKAANGLLSVKHISTEDRDFALSRKEWVAELTLSFGAAYQLLQKITTPQLSEEDRLLKLALLAELSGHNPDPYYAEFMRVTKDRQKAEIVLSSMIRRAHNPYLIFTQYQRFLRQDPELYARLCLEIFARTHDFRFATGILKTQSVRQTQSGRILGRFIFLQDFKKIYEMVTRHRLWTKSDRTLSSSLKERMSLLRKTEGFAQRAVDSGDWTLQVVTLTTVANQNRRLATEIAGLPTPRRLSSVQKRDYRRLLSQQAIPYFDKFREVNATLAQLWKQSVEINTLATEAKTFKGSLRSLASEEYKTIYRIAPPNEQSRLGSAVVEQEPRPSTDRLKEAQMSVKADPFSVSKLKNLKVLEEKAGREPMVAFLDARLERLQSGEGK